MERSRTQPAIRMIAIITEKPSVAHDIARVLNIHDRKNGYFEGADYLITWAYGHLVGLALPEEYGIKGFKTENLPILPDPFKLVPRRLKASFTDNKGVKGKSQLSIIKDVFSRCDSIIVATDAGREGELIFRWIYHYLQCSKPFSRLWISSLTDQSITEGLADLKNGKEFDNLFVAAQARSQADWLIGINASRALCITSGEGNNSLGRVQTPTLAMICARYIENKLFVPEPFWQLLLHIKKGEKSFTCKAVDLISDSKQAEGAFRYIKKQQEVKVSNIVENKSVLEPPLLHDLTSLQKEANIRYGFSAEKTLKLAQTLYEKKFITYPRTGSRYITKDVFEKVPELITLLQSDKSWREKASQISVKKINKRSVNNAKVTDHHALLITEIAPSHLKTEERKIYDLIAGRLLESFSSAHIRNVTSIEFACGSYLFSVKGYVIVDNGWKDIFNPTEEEPEENEQLPALEIGEILQIESYNCVQKSTKPKPLFTEATLLAAMEHAGREITDKEKRNAMKNCGLGTPATRAGIIETLFRREYIIRNNKNLLPTKKGMFIYNAVKNMRISDVEFTASWEEALKKIEREPTYYETFMKALKIHTKQVTDEIISIRLPQETDLETPFICPRCRLGKIIFLYKIAKCKNSACNLTVFRQKGNKNLTDNQLSSLFKTGRTPLLKGCKEGKEEPFNSHIGFDDKFNLIYIPPEEEPVEPE